MLVLVLYIFTSNRSFRKKLNVKVQIEIWSNIYLIIKYDSHEAIGRQYDGLFELQCRSVTDYSYLSHGQKHVPIIITKINPS